MDNIQFGVCNKFPETKFDPPYGVTRYWVETKDHGRIEFLHTEMDNDPRIPASLVAYINNQLIK